MVGSVTFDGGFYGSASAGNFISQVHQAVDRKLGTRSVKRPHASLLGRRMRPSGPRDLCESQEPIDYVLPSRKKADSLMDIFRTQVHPLYPFVDLVELMSDYQRLWTGEELLEDESSFLCITNVIFALACQMEVAATAKERLTSSAVFFRRAQNFLTMWKSGSLRTIQSLLLMTLYLQSTNEPHQCWMLVGDAVRTAQSLGLHLPDTSTQVPFSREREIIRRVWHGCIHMDRFLAMAYGRPAMVGRALAAAVPLPISMNEEEFQPRSRNIETLKVPSMADFFIWSLKLYEIIHEMGVEFYAQQTRAANALKYGFENYFGICAYPGKGISILDIDRKLMTWEKELPIHLKDWQDGHLDIPPDELTEPERIFARQAVILRQKFLHVRLLSLRPILSTFIASEIDDSEGLSSFGSMLSSRLAHQCSVVCVKVAQEAVNLVYSNRSTSFGTMGLVAAWWFNVLYIYSAATVLIAAKLKSSLISELGDDSISQSWKEAMDILEGYISFSDSIPKLVATLQVLHDKIPAVHSQHRQQMTQDQQNSTSNPASQLRINQPLAWNGQIPKSSESIGWPAVDSEALSTQHTYERNMGFTTLGDGTVIDLNGMALDLGDLSWLDAGPFDF